MAEGFCTAQTVYLVETQDAKHSLLGIFYSSDDADEYIRQTKETASTEELELVKRAYDVSIFFRRH